MLQPTIQFHWKYLNSLEMDGHPTAFYRHRDDWIAGQVLQQKWEHPNNVDDEGFPHLGEWRDIGVERE